MIPFPKIQKPIFIILSLLGVIFVALAVVLFVPSSSPATPVITWSPESVTETISPGSSKVVNISFTSSKNLANVTVWVVPELDPFIQVQSETFNQITKGQTNNLILNISANQDSPPVTFDGTVHLKVGAKTYSQTLKIILKVVTPQTIISDFQNAAIQGDVDKMVENFHPSIKDAYKNDFIRAKTEGILDKIANTFQTMQMVYIKTDHAKYEVQVTENEEVVTFYIYLIRDENGVWKIYSL